MSWWDNFVNSFLSSAGVTEQELAKRVTDNPAKPADSVTSVGIQPAKPVNINDGPYGAGDLGRRLLQQPQSTVLYETLGTPVRWGMEQVAAGALTLQTGGEIGFGQARNLVQGNRTYVDENGVVRNTPWYRTGTGGVSLGQSLTGLVGTIMPGEQGTDALDWTNSEQVQGYFSEGPQKWVSGSLDLAGNIFMDPLIWGNVAARSVRLRNFARPIRTEKDITRAVAELDAAAAGQASPWNPFVDYIMENAADETALLARSTIFESFNSEDLAASLAAAGRKGDRALVTDILKVAVGDDVALTRLVARKDMLAANIAKWRLRLDALENGILTAPNEQYVETIRIALAKATETNEVLLRALGKSDPVTGQTMFTGTPEAFAQRSVSKFTWVENLRNKAARARQSTIFDEQRVTVDGLPVRVLTWLSPSGPIKEAPSGIFNIGNFGAKESWRELVATSRVVARQTGKDYRPQMNEYIRLGTKEERWSYLQNLEKQFIEDMIAAKVFPKVKDLDPQMVDAVRLLSDRLINAKQNLTARVWGETIDRNYIIYDGTGDPIVVKQLDDWIKAQAAAEGRSVEKVIDELRNAPQLGSQAASTYTFMDTQAYANVLDENKLIIRELLDIIQDEVAPALAQGAKQSQIKNVISKTIDDILENPKAAQTAGLDTAGQASALAQSLTPLDKARRDLLVQLADNFYGTVWKPITLLSLKYGVRNVLEGSTRSIVYLNELAANTGVSRVDVYGDWLGNPVESTFNAVANMKSRFVAASQRRNAAALTPRARSAALAQDALVANSAQGLKQGLREMVSLAKRISTFKASKSVMPQDIVDWLDNPRSFISQLKTGEARRFVTMLLDGDIDDALKIIDEAQDLSLVVSDLTAFRDTLVKTAEGFEGVGTKAVEQGRTFYHGTPQEFKVGDIIEPRSQTSGGSIAFGTEDLNTAATHASQMAHFDGKDFGNIYIVEPVNPNSIIESPSGAPGYSVGSSSGFRVVGKLSSPKAHREPWKFADEVYPQSAEIASASKYERYLDQRSVKLIADYQSTLVETAALVDNLIGTKVNAAAAWGEFDKLIQGTNPILRRTGDDMFEVAPGVELPDWASGQLGLFARGEAAADKAYANTVLSTNRLIGEGFLQRTTRNVDVLPTDKNWSKAYTDFINADFRSDAVIFRILRGESDENIIKFLAAPDNRGYLEAIGLGDKFKVADLQSHIDKSRILVDLYTPEIPGAKRGLLKQLVLDGKFDEVQALRIPQDVRPTVSGTDIAAVSRVKNVGQVWRESVSKVFKYIGTLPETTLSRHPFYRAVYRTEVRRMVKIAQARGVNVQSAQFIDRAQRAAHRRAYKTLNETLYSVERRTDPAQFLRFVSPFYMAQQSSSRFWLGQTFKNPALPYLGLLAWNTPNKVFEVVNDKGESVESSLPTLSNERIMLTLPEPIAKFFNVQGQDYLTVSKTSLDLVTNGAIPVIPQLSGALITIPASLVLANTDAQAVLSDMGFDGDFVETTILPYLDTYRTDPVEQLAPMPAWLRSFVNGTQATPQSAARTNLIFEQKMLEAEMKGIDLTPKQLAQALKDSAEEANRSYLIEAVFSFTSPFSTKLSNEQQLLKQEYNRYRQRFGPVEGALMAEKDMGLIKSTYARSSLSDNPAGIMSTPQTERNLRQHSGLAAELAAQGDEAFSMLGNLFNEGLPDDYSALVNARFYDTRIGGKSLKSTKDDLEQIQRERSENLGWSYYIPMKQALTAYAEKNGIAIGSSAWDRQIKPALDKYAELVGNKFPEWEDARSSFDTGRDFKNYRALRYAFYNGVQRNKDGSIKTNSEGMPMWSDGSYMASLGKRNPIAKALVYWVPYRDALAQVLAKRESKDINAQSNADIKLLLDKYAIAVGSKFPEFANLYERSLSRDTLQIVKK